MNILKLLKDNYPEYKVNDASDRNLLQIQKIADICVDCPHIIVYLQRNNKTETYFKLIEMVENMTGICDDERIETIIINKDNYVYVRKNENNTMKILRCINKNLINDISCCVCLEPKSNYKKNHVCGECQIPVCITCIGKMNNDLCPCCKSDLHVIKISESR